MRTFGGEKMMKEIKAYALAKRIKTIRLDVRVQNRPAIVLYERCGYHYVDTVDLGLNLPGLKWFRLFGLILSKS